MSTHGAKLALQQLHASRGPPQPVRRVPPTPRPATPTFAPSPTHEVRHSSPTRTTPAPTTEETSETTEKSEATETSETTEGFPAIEGIEAAPAAEAVAPVATRGRRRSSSFREDQAFQATVLRTAQNSSVEVSKPGVESPTKSRHRRTPSVREIPFAPATGISENTHIPETSKAAKVDYEEDHKDDTHITQPTKTVDTEAETVYYEEPHASYTQFPQQVKMGKDKKVPKPGPAKLGPNSTPQEWLQCALRNQYLPERIMKQLCESVKEKLMEESNIQPVSTPVTICGDLHGQFYDVLELFRIAGGIPSDDVVTEASPAPKGVISSEDIEPPSVITDPKLKKKLKNVSLEDRLGSGSGVSDEDDAEEEQRGRSRGPVNTASLGPLKEGNTGIPGNQNYIFLGDFVDRGYFSLETLTLLLCLKNLWPDRITLIRGNHESRQITQVYGFYEECLQKYGNASVWKACTQVFDFLILGAVVDGKVLCVHGGLSPEIRTIDQIRVIARAQEIPHEGAFCDLVWSDPEDIGTWAISPRGAGWLFGDKVAREFNHVNNFDLIARAHQLVNEGFKWHFEDKSVVTVWSAPNYCYRCGNVASIMNLREDLKPNFNIFGAVPDNQRAVPAATGRSRNDYFL